MTSEPAATPQKPIWLTATEEDFAATDVNLPLADISTIDCFYATTAFGKAAKEEGEKQNSVGERVFAMLGAVCSFYFKPSDANEPFGPMSQMGEQRSAQPSDFKGDPACLLASQIDRITNLGVRTRLADTVWLLDRKQVTAGSAAITGYTDIAQGIVDRSASLKRADANEHSYEVPQFLRRALRIGKATGWDKSHVIPARQLVSALRTKAAVAREVNSFLRYAGLDLDYQLSSPTDIAAEAELIANAVQGQEKHSLMHCAARAYSQAKDEAERDRCLMAASEALVSVADDHKFSAMQETHWLEKAVSEMRRLPSAKSRWTDLKHRLVDSQTRILDEMTTISHSEDISEQVEHAQKAVSGLSLAKALRQLAFVSFAPSPKQLEDDAKEAIAEAPLSSIFASTTYDSQGKPVHKNPGGNPFDDEGYGETIRAKIAFLEKFRRIDVIAKAVKPVRQTIMIEHCVDEPVLLIICTNSAFVPPQRTAIFVGGLLRFMQGDMSAALHTLAPCWSCCS